MRKILKGKEGNTVGRSERREFGVSTEPGETYMDQVQREVQETGTGPDGEVMNVPVETGQAASAEESKPVEQSDKDQPREVEVDRKAALEILDPEDQKVDEPKQVEDTHVIFVPHKDFEARVNQEIFSFRTDVPTRVSRDIANMLTEDKSRGYVRD